MTALSLGHGDPPAEHGPQLRVEVRADPDDPGAGPELRRALAELEGRALVLQARDLAVDEVELVRVADIEPYVEGTSRLDEATNRRREATDRRGENQG